MSRQPFVVLFLLLTVAGCTDRPVQTDNDFVPVSVIEVVEQEVPEVEGQYVKEADLLGAQLNYQIQIAKMNRLTGEE
ncbi:MAG: hypothetical protein D4R67_04655 [Bacteroidetes bacterium]|nr:MAG: hypothetical protein D4R67_04655 [Bacteroidota bacterium]